MKSGKERNSNRDHAIYVADKEIRKGNPVVVIRVDGRIHYVTAHSSGVDNNGG